MLQEKAALDVTDRTTNFDHHDLGLGCFSYHPDTALDLVGHVWNHLDRSSQVVTVTFRLITSAYTCPAVTLHTLRGARL